MKVLVSGSTGLVGSALAPALKERGDEVFPLVRSTPAGDGAAYWSPETGKIDAGVFSTVDGVVHLAGENIAAGRWTAVKKARIRESRVAGTRLICDTLAQADPKPRVLVCASAIGFYGSRGDTLLNEDSDRGEGFLADVCSEWEAATAPASEAGVRVVNLRIGVILSRRGGALATMLTPFKLGLGGKVGSGRQYMSWISLDDVVRAIQFALDTDELQGPVNAAAPGAVTNNEFTKTLGKVLKRPTILPMPAFAARVVLGEMADELLLGSCRVEPRRLVDAGFKFEHGNLESALRHVLQR